MNCAGIVVVKHLWLKKLDLIPWETLWSIINAIELFFLKNDSNFFPGADNYINKDVNKQIHELQKIYIDKDIFIIGGSEIIKLTIDIIQEFYLTRIYGNYNCEKFLDITMIKNNMKLTKKIEGDNTCHFEIWKRWNST